MEIGFLVLFLIAWSVRLLAKKTEAENEKLEVLNFICFIHKYRLRIGSSPEFNVPFCLLLLLVCSC